MVPLVNHEYSTQQYFHNTIIKGYDYQRLSFLFTFIYKKQLPFKYLLSCVEAHNKSFPCKIAQQMNIEKPQFLHY